MASPHPPLAPLPHAPLQHLSPTPRPAVCSVIFQELDLSELSTIDRVKLDGNLGVFMGVFALKRCYNIK